MPNMILMKLCQLYKRQLKYWTLTFQAAWKIFVLSIQALEALNKKDLTEIKSYTKPPDLVEMVMRAVMILRNSEPSWTEAKRQLGNYQWPQWKGGEIDTCFDSTAVSTYLCVQSVKNKLGSLCSTWKVFKILFDNIVAVVDRGLLQCF